jgi:hypothetical protein
MFSADIFFYAIERRMARRRSSKRILRQPPIPAKL